NEIKEVEVPMKAFLPGGRQNLRGGPFAIPSPALMQRFFLRAGEFPEICFGLRGKMCKSLMPQWDLDPTSMAKKSHLNPEPPRRRRGRPTREEELQRALVELGIDPALVDPLRVLASVAGDATAPASARVAAARALLAARDPARNR